MPMLTIAAVVVGLILGLVMGFIVAAMMAGIIMRENERLRAMVGTAESDLRARRN